jgi:ABC-type transporter Mla MlaB component
MPFSIDNVEGKCTMRLEGAITIQCANDLAMKLCETLEDGASVGVETAGLEDIDTSALQLLCSLRKTVPSLLFNNASEVLIAAVDRCGLRRELLGAREEM